MALICPACKKVHLKAHQDPATGLEIDVCSKCWGLWFDANELSEFFKSGHLKRRFFLEEDAQPSQFVGFTISTRARKCPRCHKPMTEKLFADVSIDICQECQGLWLDDGELQRIVKQYKKGAKGAPTVIGELDKAMGTGGARDLGGIIKMVLSFFGK